MIYILVILPSLFIGLGFLITEKNAKNVLAGYNTLSDEERKKVNIRAYLQFFRRFHIFLGISYFLFGLLLHLVSENATGVFMAIYPILSYIYLLWKGNRYFRNATGKLNRLGIFILSFTLVFILILIFLVN